MTNQITPFVPQTQQEWVDIANTIVRAGLAPKGMETPEKCFLALQMGAQLGLFPMQSIQEITPIHGRPYVSTMCQLGIVQASGLLEDKVEDFIEENGKVIGAKCTLKRKGMKTPITRTFTLEEAKVSELLGKDNWKKDPKGMLQIRALRKSLASGFSDVLRGMTYSSEEARDMDMVNITPSEATTVVYDNPIVESMAPTRETIMLYGTEEHEAKELPVTEVYSYIRTECEAINSVQQFDAYYSWWRLIYVQVKNILTEDETKELKEIFFPKKKLYGEKPVADAA